MDATHPQYHRQQLTLGNVDSNTVGRRIRSVTRVVARVCLSGVSHSEARPDLGMRIDVHTDATSLSVVVDHVRVVIPKNILRSYFALENKWK